LRAVLAVGADQAFVERNAAGTRLRDRFEGQRNPAVIERGDNLVGGAQALLADRIALGARAIGSE